MALAKDTPRAVSPKGGGNFQVVNAAVAYLGARLALCTPTHGTAASRGRVKPWSGAAGEFSVGFSRSSQTTGNTSANPITNVGLMTEDAIVENLAVSGLASSEFQRDALKYVYASDDGTYTLTRPSAPNRTPVGIVWRGKTASVCDVFMFGMVTQLVLSAMGGCVQTLNLGVITPTLGAAGDLLKGIVLSGHGKIIDAYAICANAPSDADVHMDVELEIGGTNLTGGTITLDFADAVADKKSGTAITANNEFHDGDLLDVEALAAGLVAGTATDTGSYVLYATVEYLPGL